MLKEKCILMSAVRKNILQIQDLCLSQDFSKVIVHFLKYSFVPWLQLISQRKFLSIVFSYMEAKLIKIS